MASIMPLLWLMRGFLCTQTKQYRVVSLLTAGLQSSLSTLRAPTPLDTCPLTPHLKTSTPGCVPQHGHLIILKLHMKLTACSCRVSSQLLVQLQAQLSQAKSGIFRSICDCRRQLLAKAEFVRMVCCYERRGMQAGQSGHEHCIDQHVLSAALGSKVELSTERFSQRYMVERRVRAQVVAGMHLQKHSDKH